MWPPVKEAKDENRYELLIIGKELTKALKSNDGELDPDIFKLTQLNFLRLANSSLEIIPDEIGKLRNLTHLELQNNGLVSLPKYIGKLDKLKLLDISDNKIEKLPSTLNYLESLTTFNARNNCLRALISFDNCETLSVLDIRNNKIEDIDDIFQEHLTSISELYASNNRISEIPNSVRLFINLKVLSLAENKITDIPSDLSACSKLKELDLKENPLTDRRLKKLIESDRGYTRVVLDYIRQHSKDKNSKGGSAKGKKSRKISVLEEENSEVPDICHKLSVLSVKGNLEVKFSEEIRPIRGYIVLAIIKELDLTGTNLKKFLALQTTLHETTCEKRLAATIATHDLKKVKSPLTYCAKAPEHIIIQPLGKTSQVTAKEFLKTLYEEADAQRKQLKRNTLSGIHKYLSLVVNLDLWPCLIDSTDTVISFPPITNSENTKIEITSTEILLEVTSGSTLKKAKEVMEALILAIVDAGICKNKTENSKSQLQIEQVRICDKLDGSLRLVYPSKNDLAFEDKRINVVRS